MFLQFEHDFFALGGILKLFTCKTSVLTSIIHLLQTNQMVLAMEEMERLGDLDIQPVKAFANILNGATGSPPRKDAKQVVASEQSL